MFKPGQRIKYIGHTSKCKDKDCLKASRYRKLGTTGTVKSSWGNSGLKIIDSTEVQWDGESKTCHVMTKHVKLVPKKIKRS
jgi:hypothetical protein